MRQVNVHLYQSTFTHESRILKITESLASARVFEKIYVIARGNGDLPACEIIGAGREVLRLPDLLSRASKTLGLLEWLLRAAWQAWRARPACVNCHSLLTLPVGVLIKWIVGARLIYDTHELESETVSLRGIRKRLYKLAERLLVPQADEVVVVGNAIADWYKRQYGLTNVHVIRNLPKAVVEPEATSSILKQSLGIPRGEMVFLYQGNVGVGRGIELLLRVFAKAPRDKHLVVLGYGKFVPIVRRAAQTCRQIHFLPEVPPADLLQWTAGADVGLSVIENACLSYYYCLPNKLFEYLACGLPIIVSDFPEMSKLVSDAQCGWSVSVDELALQKLIDGITWREVQSKAEGARKHRSAYRWEAELPKLLQLYGSADRQSVELRAA